MPVERNRGGEGGRREKGDRRERKKKGRFEWILL
jgi:hypothetical protein